MVSMPSIRKKILKKLTIHKDVKIYIKIYKKV